MMKMSGVALLQIGLRILKKIKVQKILLILFLSLSINLTFAGKCSGGSNCHACSDCSACKNCSENDGTCSVCSSERNEIQSFSSSKNEKSFIDKIFDSNISRIGIGVLVISFLFKLKNNN